jgi:hypothetical protein
MPATALRSFLPLLGVLALCPLAALVIGDDPHEPVQRAAAIVELERAVGIYVEPAVHAWAREHDNLMTVAGAFYVIAHIGVAGWALAWTWILRRDVFPRVRAAFVCAQVILVAIYVALPTAPPRLLPGAGFEDTLSGLWGKEAADSAHALQSPYAALPSGHVVFALVAGATFARYGDQAWLRVFGWVYPPLMATVTIATANHFVFDVVAATLVAAVAWWLAAAPRPRVLVAGAAKT